MTNNSTYNLQQLLDVEKDILKNACHHPVWLQLGKSYKEDDEDVFDVRCIECGLEKSAHVHELDYQLNAKTGLYEANVLDISHLLEQDRILPELLFEVIKTEYAKFAKNYELPKLKNNEQIDVKETAKEFIKTFRK